MIISVVASFLGTMAFAVLFGVPKKYNLSCSLIAAAGWALYYPLVHYLSVPATTATFIAAAFVVLVSRYTAVWEKCPVTVFLITGIFPLVPGGSIYWTAYYLVTSQTELAVSSGLMAVKLAFALVLGIVAVSQLPNAMFQIKKKQG